MCSFGVNYQRVDADLLIAGVVIRNWPYHSQARGKRLKVAERTGTLISADALTRTVAACCKRRDAAADEIQQEKAKLRDEYTEDEQFKEDFLQQFRKEIQKGLSFVHDYKQINAQITQNINVLIESRCQGGSFEEKLDQAHHSEKAIYHASKLLEEKLNVAKFLVAPDWLHLSSECTRFRVHGLVLKYLRIYEYWFSANGIRVTVAGESHNEIVANARACGVIPHTFIDNALKYSPHNSKVEIDIQDQDEGGVLLAVSSYGPRILPGEDRKIFRPFFRGRHAMELAEEGAGYGLYVSQLVAKTHLGSSITVEQDIKDERAGRYWTTFELVFPSQTTILL